MSDIKALSKLKDLPTEQSIVSPGSMFVEALRSDFQFDTRIASKFDDHVRANVPYYDEVQNLVAFLSDWYIGRDSLILDLGCATGETSSLIADRHSQLKGLHFVLMDESKAMLDKAWDKMAKHKIENCGFGGTKISYEIHCGDIIDPIPDKFHNASFAVMAFTLQFVPIAHRMKVLKNVKQSLRSGGALCLIEKVEGGVAEFERAFMRILDERKMLAGMDAGAVVHKEQAIRGRLVPLSLDENIRMLRKTGFDSVEVFWRWLSFCGIIATWGRNPSEENCHG